ncbi:hypothetical protein DFH27DRAFT_621446 [Peziza echinospora]|nr:hypothetical protein DFH27DRAFT_621446 [Peziza echinospora]
MAQGKPIPLTPVPFSVISKTSSWLMFMNPSCNPISIHAGQVLGIAEHSLTSNVESTGLEIDWADVVRPGPRAVFDGGARPPQTVCDDFYTRPIVSSNDVDGDTELLAMVSDKKRRSISEEQVAEIAAQHGGTRLKGDAFDPEIDEELPPLPDLPSMPPGSSEQIKPEDFNHSAKAITLDTSRISKPPLTLQVLYHRHNIQGQWVRQSVRR